MVWKAGNCTFEAESASGSEQRLQRCCGNCRGGNSTRDGSLTDFRAYGAAPMTKKTLVAVAVLSACGANSPRPDPPGPPGTWTCHQIVESCDSMCRTGMCLQACSNQGSQEGGALHAALIQCAAANRCYDDGCTRALCGPQTDACLADNGGLPPIATTSGPQPPPPHDDREMTAPPPPPHDDREAPPHDTKTETAAPPPHDDGPALTMAAVTGEWSYGAKTAVGAPDPKTGARKPGTGSGGTLRLNSDGRFERATNVEA